MASGDLEMIFTDAEDPENNRIVSNSNGHDET
jgi:hypothetical protein